MNLSENFTCILSAGNAPFLLSFACEVSKFHLYSIEGRIKDLHCGTWMLEEVVEILLDADELRLQVQTNFAEEDGILMQVERIDTTQKNEDIEFQCFFSTCPANYFVLLDELKNTGNES